mgnify:CR=1 FL=1
MTILVTGSAGFIGSALTQRLLKNEENVVGLDNLNSYYDVNLKLSRLDQIYNVQENSKGNFNFHKFAIEEKELIADLFKTYKFSTVVHLAAQAGVRYSIENPQVYFQSNLVGFANILEQVRLNNIANFIFASSSSVYGENKFLPFKEEHKTDYPVSLYGATKKSNEILAHSYSHLYGIPTTGLRFFTVYGPWGRPDMAPIIFTKSILKNEKIKIFNNGDMRRDFTYIDDIVEGIFRCCYKPAYRDLDSEQSFTKAPFRIFNIGNGDPIHLIEFIELLEMKLGVEANKEYLPMQKGDVLETFSSTESLGNWINYKPNTSIEEGVEAFIKWYLEYYG